ncbi:hypothetical protein D3C77_562480 [compost metagenome]
MTTLIELAQHIERLYPLKDKQAGTRYRIVSQLAGLTELEEMGGKPRYIPSKALQDSTLWDGAAEQHAAANTL